MEELQRGQESLTVEVNQLKTQMSLIMEILQEMLRKEGNLTLVAVTEVVTPVHLPGSIPCHELPRGYHP